MESSPHDEDDFKFEMIFMTWSGCTLLNFKEHLMFLMSIDTSVRGFPGLAGKFSLRYLTFLFYKILVHYSC